MKKIQLKNFDFLLLFSTFLLVVIGVLFIYSSNTTSTGMTFSKEYLKQILWFASGIFVFFVVTIYPYGKLKAISPYLYAVSLLLLLLTLAIGREVNGARSWIGIGDIGIQPSEFTKLTVIIFLATYLNSIGNDIKNLRNFLIALIIAFFPAGLILLQPDLGTALVYIPIFLFMVFIGGARIDYILFIILLIFFTGVFISANAFSLIEISDKYSILNIFNDKNVMMYIILSLLVVLLLALIGYLLFKRRYFYWILYSTSIFLLSTGFARLAMKIMKNYQIMRLIIFLKPDIDPKGYGWNIIQSVTAVGSGGFWGKGFLHGTQSHYRYLPQQSTDFIFSILSEEWGFAGCMFVFLLFTIILIRAIIISYKSKDFWAILAGAGIVGMIFFHVTINIGMAIGVMPITGIPLIFLSYGGSSLWTGLIGIAIINNIHIHQKVVKL